MQFKEGHTSVKSGERSGRPSMNMNQLLTDKVRSAVLELQLESPWTSWGFHLVWYSPF